MHDRPSIHERKQRALAKVSLVDLIEREVKLSGSAGTKNRRGKCPFHSGNSASFSVQTEKGFYRCFGCGASGDAFRFVQDMYGLSFIDALTRLEGECGEENLVETPRPLAARPVQRERAPVQRRAREVEYIEPIDMGRAIWGMARFEPAFIRRYFEGRGVPASVLSDERLQQFRYTSECPVHGWPVDKGPKGVPIAPAVIGLVRVPRWRESSDGGFVEFVPVGVHVTYLNPEGTGTMIRRKPWAKADDPDPMLPKRRMLGAVGKGAILLGDYRRDAHLFVGEGNETVLSAMAMAEAAPDAIGVATLSLDNLQGDPRLWKGGIWPLHAIEPDPERRPCFTIPRHTGPVTGVIDADMSPLRGQRDRKTGQPAGEAVIERKGGPIVHRAITGAERARICAQLMVKGWRAVGAGPVDAIRPPMGMDFNDAVKGERP